MFHADLHVHSKHSRATSRDLDLEHLAWWAARKGIAVVGTGDCVHPGWLAEIRDKLVPAGNGLFRLKPEIAQAVERTLPPACRTPVSFMLSTEISTIYKKGEKTRKVHHLIYVPDFATADRLAARLAAIGNIASDGRPILGLDSRDLLEIALDSGPHSYLVPAHIWTPWFAAMGSQSGFDSIDDCYGDLAPHIFAVETGLSSDPAMNRRVSSLDRFRLTSNSDAHSPAKLGREATRFSCEPDYFAIRRALETGAGYHGTVEFFPEEGKYHADGHRACGVRLDPRETIAQGGLCPVCGGRLTVGVAHRVEALADRPVEEVVALPTDGDAASLVPLPEMIAEIVGVGVASKAVEAAYERTAALGAELDLLEERPVEDVAKVHPLLGEAVARLRAGAVIRQAGYDGEYGVIRLFEPGELERLSKGALLFDGPLGSRAKPARRVRQAEADAAEGGEGPAPVAGSPRGGVLAGLDADQAEAAAAVDGPVVVLAGPGSGKTRMLTHRIAHLVRDHGLTPAECLAVTFTRRATEELAARLAALLPGAPVTVHSFHTLGLAILRAHAAEAGLAPGFRIAADPERAALLVAETGLSEREAAAMLRAISRSKRSGLADDAAAGAAGTALDAAMRARNLVDFDDLIRLPAALLAAEPGIAAAWRGRFRHIVADEFQDVDDAQYRLLLLLAGPEGRLCVIGDPNQAIYGFRGADAACFARFAADFPAARTFRLGRNYRSTGTIVAAAASLIGAPPEGATRPMGAPIALHVAADERAEAEFVAHTIEEMIGGHDLLAANALAGRQSGADRLGFADFAVLYRTDGQAAALRAAFDHAGIPFKKSAPARIADHAGVRAALAAVARQADGTLGDRLAAAFGSVREGRDDLDPATRAEAERWLTAIAASAPDEAAFGEAVALASEADFFDPRAARVALLTIHAAKGLEFPVVFVVGLDEGLLPFSFGGMPPEPDALAEERRLCYVALTRAQDRLVLTCAAERSVRGARRAVPPSRFLADLPPDVLVRPARGSRRRRPAVHQLDLF
ncbi:UvrD-helicase domain-containing protein [Prosthecomicrobium pneumaticum]|uniref:Uncharacterized protein (TIGR00375 family) n=1 Tax=Prosthecomicrobium pneumaticum TaxID=81895 RepID=A0A7W9FP87_9HYPH|nr:UvrD-helicase domain-containing protein [Prosthecomicrobium pneumaticum]MBB5754375.1 uncharacterized protein (TIGR00375 family) [Prosthecomicrobium pneumaticum]